MEDEEEGVLKVASNGTKRWFDKKNRYHRLNGPAIIYYNGTKAWYKNGKLHRDDGPAVEYANGTKYWFKDGEPYEPSAHELITWKMKKKES